jgi:hypothetical protein
VAAERLSKTRKKGLAGRGAAVHANKIWLISVATVIFNFPRKSMPRMGPATAACKKLKVNILP